MEQKHGINTYLYATSRMIERAGYYGLRSIILLYLLSETSQLEREESLRLYGWFTASVLISQVIGAVLGDLLIGNKRAIIVGSLLQAAGAFTLCYQSIFGIYAGLLLVVLGGGLYTPNLLSTLGKSYLNKIKLLDAGFTLIYISTSIGAFLGVLLISYLRIDYDWNTAFISAGFLLLLSLIPYIVSKQETTSSFSTTENSEERRIFKVIFTCALVGVFWLIYDLSATYLYEIKGGLKSLSNWSVSGNLSEELDAILPFVTGLVASVVWSYFYSNQFFKLLLGFIFGSFSFGIMFLVPANQTESFTALILISFILLALAEVHIFPIIHSILTQYTNPKYLAIFISLSALALRLPVLLSTLLFEKIQSEPMDIFRASWMVLILISLGLAVYNYLEKKQKTIE